MEALPIFLDRLTSPFLAIVISVTLVLLFGECVHSFPLAADCILTNPRLGR